MIEEMLITRPRPSAIMPRTTYLLIRIGESWFLTAIRCVRGIVAPPSRYTVNFEAFADAVSDCQRPRGFGLVATRMTALHDGRAQRARPIFADV
jgi:hypothetical protein